MNGPPGERFLHGEVEAHRLLRPLLPGELVPPGAPGEERVRALNPYAGCELGCVHCTAEAARPAPPDRRVDAKRGAAGLLARELARAARDGDLTRPILLGTATDPWQPLEAERRVTRSLLEVLLDAARGPDAAGPDQAHGLPGRDQAHGLPGRDRAPRLLVVTRSDLVLSDLPLLRELDRALHLRLGVPVPTLDRDLAARLEPGAPSPARRLEVVQALARAGLQVGVLCLPILPELTESPLALRRIVCEARGAGARWLAARVLALRGRTRPAFMGWLAAHHPELVRRYRRLYRQASLPPLAVQDRIRRVVQALRTQYGLPAWVPFPPPPRLQRDLFAEPRVLPVVDPAA